MSPDTFSTNAAFGVVFVVFLIAFLVLAVVSMRWAIRRDRASRAAWLERRRTQTEPSDPARNGRGPKRR